MVIVSAEAAAIRCQHAATSGHSVSTSTDLETIQKETHLIFPVS